MNHFYQTNDKHAKKHTVQQDLRVALETGPKVLHWALECQPKGWHWDALGHGVPARRWHWHALGPGVPASRLALGTLVSTKARLPPFFLSRITSKRL